MEIKVALDVMRDFGRVAKGRGYIKCDSDLFAGVGAYKAFNGDGLGDPELKEAYVMARDYLAAAVADTVTEYYKQLGE